MDTASSLVAHLDYGHVQEVVVKEVFVDEGRNEFIKIEQGYVKVKDPEKVTKKLNDGAQGEREGDNDGERNHHGRRGRRGRRGRGRRRRHSDSEDDSEPDSEESEPESENYSESESESEDQNTDQGTSTENSLSLSPEGTPAMPSESLPPLVNSNMTPPKHKFDNVCISTDGVILSTENIYPKNYLAQTSSSVHLLTSSFCNKVIKIDPSTLSPSLVSNVPIPPPRLARDVNLLSCKHGGLASWDSQILAPILSNDINFDLSRTPSTSTPTSPARKNAAPPPPPLPKFDYSSISISDLNQVPFSSLTHSPLSVTVSSQKIDYLGCTFICSPPASALSDPPLPDICVNVSLPNGNITLSSTLQLGHETVIKEKVPGSENQYYVTLLHAVKNHCKLSRDDVLTFTFSNTSVDTESNAPDVIPDDDSDTDSLASSPSTPTATNRNTSAAVDQGAARDNAISNLSLVSLHCFGTPRCPPREVAMTSDSNSLYFVTITPPSNPKNTHILSVNKTDHNLQSSAPTLSLQYSSLNPIYLTRGYSLYTNGHFLTIGVPLSTIEYVDEESSSSKKMDSLNDDTIKIKFFSFNLSTGIESSVEVLEFLPNNAPSVLAFDLRNNMIHGATPEGTVMRWRNMGLQVRLNEDRSNNRNNCRPLS